MQIGVMPTLWKSANITPVHKGDNRELITNYRSISLLPLREMLPLVSSLEQPAVNSSDVLEIERPASRLATSQVKQTLATCHPILKGGMTSMLLISCYGDHKHLFGKR